MSFSDFVTFSYSTYPISTAILHKIKHTNKQGCIHHTSQKSYDKNEECTRQRRANDGI